MILHDEIQADPLGLGYAAYLPDDLDALCAKLNAPDYQMVKTRFVSARTILAECGSSGAVILDKLDAAKASISAVKWAMVFLLTDSGLDIGHPATQAMVDQLVAGNVLNAEEGEMLKAMAKQPASRAEVIGLGVVTPNDIRAAGF